MVQTAGRREWGVRLSNQRRLPMLWTILIVIVIILAVIGFFSVLRGRA
jgi:hypothetical protein